MASEEGNFGFPVLFESPMDSSDRLVREVKQVLLMLLEWCDNVAIATSLLDFPSEADSQVMGWIEAVT